MCFMLWCRKVVCSSFAGSKSMSQGGAPRACVYCISQRLIGVQFCARDVYFGVSVFAACSGAASKNVCSCQVGRLCFPGFFCSSLSFYGVSACYSRLSRCETQASPQRTTSCLVTVGNSDRLPGDAFHLDRKFQWLCLLTVT